MAVRRGVVVKVCIHFWLDYYLIVRSDMVSMLTCINTDGGRCDVVDASQSLCPRFIESFEAEEERNMMFNSSELSDELRTLKTDMKRILNTAGDDLIGASKKGAETIADQIQTELNNLRDTLGREEQHLERMVQDRPMATVAAAFVLGIVVGSLLRRH
jgi:ElaB/YqjD/DUF883 family membrane-anchored ribosome-binding protein